MPLSLDADNRGLLASPELEGQPLNGVYFFTRESSRNHHRCRRMRR
jgi:hypothetical protein